MKVCIFAPEIGPEVETIAFYCQLAGATTIIAIHPDGERHSPHNFRRALRNNTTIPVSDNPITVDVLIADAFTRPQYKSQLSNWSKHATETALLYPHDGMTFKRRVGHIVKGWPVSAKSRTAIFFGDRRLSLDAVSVTFQRRAFFLPYLHPQTFTDAGLAAQALSEVEISAQRPYTFGFMGNKGPQQRSDILTLCKSAVGDASCLWLEYGDDEHHLALEPDQFMSKLTEMDFCICAPGWLLWTHRVIESICRGAVPILQDLHLYGLELRDSVNCIEVKNNDWPSAIQRANRMPFERICAMRQACLQVRDRLLTPMVAATRFLEQFKR